MSFDPTKPIDDHTVFLPKGMFVDNHSGKKHGKGDDTDDGDTFVFNAADIKALNRFLAAGRLLQDTTSQYKLWLGISEELSEDLDKVIDELVKTYANIKASCVDFKDKSWERIITIAGDIKTYAAQAGGTTGNSYYTLMLQYLGAYHDELQQDNPDEKKLQEYLDGINYVVDDMVERITNLDAEADEARKRLAGFQDTCETNSGYLKAKADSVESQLEAEGNDIETLKQDRQDADEQKKHYEKLIDEKNKVFEDAPKYMWIVPIGTAVGIGLMETARQEIREYRKAIEDIKELIDDYKDKMYTAVTLKTNTELIDSQINSLSANVSPAIETLQLLQGAWASMKTDLESIKTLMEHDADKVPPVIIAQPHLETIVEEWNRLRDYAHKYIENSYLTPKEMTIEKYLDELDEAIRRSEAEYPTSQL